MPIISVRFRVCRRIFSAIFVFITVVAGITPLQPAFGGQADFFVFLTQPRQIFVLPRGQFMISRQRRFCGNLFVIPAVKTFEVETAVIRIDKLIKYNSLSEPPVGIGAILMLIVKVG